MAKSFSFFDRSEMKRLLFILCIFISSFHIASVAYAQNATIPFSAAHARLKFDAGKAAYLKGDLSMAVRHFKAALERWPVHQQAWQWLTASYQHLKQNEEYWHSLFFRERTAWALEVDLRHARRIFADIAAGQTTKVKNDPRYIKTAKELIVFYDYAICRVQTAREAELAKKLSFSQEFGLESLFGLTPDPSKRNC